MNALMRASQWSFTQVESPSPTCRDALASCLSNRRWFLRSAFLIARKERNQRSDIVLDAPAPSMKWSRKSAAIGWIVRLWTTIERNSPASSGVGLPVRRRKPRRNIRASSSSTDLLVFLPRHQASPLGASEGTARIGTRCGGRIGGSGDVPQPDGVVIARCGDRRPAREEGHIRHRPGVSGQLGPDLPAGGQVPQPDRAVGGCGGQRPAVRAEGERVDLRGVPGQGADDRSARGQVPQPYGVVVGGERQGAAIGAELQIIEEAVGHDRWRRPELPAGRHIEEPHSAVAARDGQCGATRTDRDPRGIPARLGEGDGRPDPPMARGLPYDKLIALLYGHEPATRIEREPADAPSLIGPRLDERGSELALVCRGEDPYAIARLGE